MARNMIEQTSANRTKKATTVSTCLRSQYTSTSKTALLMIVKLVSYVVKFMAVDAIFVVVYRLDFLLYCCRGFFTNSVIK